MKVIIAKDYEEMSKKAFEVMREVVKGNPRAVLGLATGSTPIGLYKSARSISTNTRGWIIPAIKAMFTLCAATCSITSISI